MPPAVRMAERVGVFEEDGRLYVLWSTSRGYEVEDITAEVTEQ